jgi:hypothetical protein
MDTPEVVERGAPDPNAAMDPLLAVLTGALDGSSPLDPLAMLKTQLDSQSDPRIMMVLRLLEQRRLQEDAALKRLQEEASIEEDAPAGSAAVQEDLESVQQAIDAVYAELDVMRARNAAFAAAVGACPLCFGDDPLCPTCRGLGVPGWRRPEPAAFRTYVLPAFARARALDTKHAAMAAAHRAAPPG